MGSSKSKAPPPKKPDACRDKKGHDYCKKLAHSGGGCKNVSGNKNFVCTCHKAYTLVGVGTKAKCVRDVCRCGTKSMIVPFGEPDFGDSGGVDNGNFGGYLDGPAGADDGNYEGDYEGNYNGNNSGGNHEVVWGFGGFVLALTLVMCFQFAKHVIKKRKLKTDKAGFPLSKEPEKIRPDLDTPEALLNKNDVERTAAGIKTV